MIRYALLLALFALPCALDAQNTACTYESCALRIDYGGLFSSARVVQGADAQRIAKANRSDELKSVLASNDSASVHYARFEKLDRTSDWLGGIGAAAWLGGLTVGLLTHADPGDAPYVALSIAGVSLGMAGGIVGRRAFNQLSESIWWYNAGLVRP